MLCALKYKHTACGANSGFRVEIQYSDALEIVFKLPDILAPTG